MAKKAAKNPRRGKVAKPGKDAPAKGKAGSAKAPKMDVFDEAAVAEELNLYWESDGGDSFVVCVGHGQWQRWPVSSVKQLARLLPNRLIALKPRDNERLSEMDRVLLHARSFRSVEKVLPALAGYRAGPHELRDGKRVIVRLPPKLVEPKEGEWPTLRELIEGRLDLSREGNDKDQSVYFHAWHKIALESLLYGEPGSYKPGHVLVLAGPVGCGKSRLQVNVSTPLLGGRAADPTAFLMGEDSFNADMMGAEHLMMEELLTSSWSAADRVKLSEAMKRVVANDSKRMRLMRTDPLTVDPFWRLTLSMNNDPDKLRAFPMLTPDFADKVVMLLVAKRPLPMSTTTAGEQRAFNDACRAELPAYAHWLLNEFVIPGEMLGTQGRDLTRFGFGAYQHPSLAEALFDDTPAAALLRLIDMAEFEGGGPAPWDDDGTGDDAAAGEKRVIKLWDLAYPLNTSGRKMRGGPWVNTRNVWEGPAETLEDLLCGQVPGVSSSVARAAHKLLSRGQVTPTLLSRLWHDKPDRVDKRDRESRRGWAIGAPSID